MSIVRNWSRLVVSLTLVAVVSVGVGDRAQPAVAATTAGCPAGTTDYYTHAVNNFGLVGSPGGSAPDAINLRDLGGHPRVLYAWSVTSTADANVSRIFDQNGSKPISSPTSGQFTTQPNARTLTFCLTGNAQPAIELTKTSTSHPDGNGDNVADAPIAEPGTVTYELVATNTGNVPLDRVTINEPTAGVTIDSCTPAQPATLAVGANLTCTATRGVSIDRIAAGGRLLNQATVDGEYRGTTTTDLSPTYVVPIANQPAIEIAKTSTSHPDGDGNGVADSPITGPGTVDYELTVTNTGDVALTNLAVTDADIATITCDGGAGLPAFLAPGARVTCTGSQTVTQGDIDAGGDIINTASASGRGGGSNVSDSASYDVPIRQDLLITATKTSTSHPDADGDGTADLPAEVDDIVSYTVTVTNTGNVDVSVTVVDSITTLTCGTTDLAPGASTDCIGTYTVTQADIDAFAPIANTATATATGPAGTTSTAIAGYLVPVLDRSELTVRKTSTSHPDTDGDQVADPGVTGAPTTVEFEVEIENTGSTTLTDIDVADLFTVTCPGGTPFDLTPGQMVTCTTSVPVSQSDFDLGAGLLNIAVASGTDGAGNDVSGGAVFIVPFVRTPAVTLTKVARAPYDTDSDGNGIADTPITAPVAVTYDLVATNTGNTTLSGVTILDPMLSGLNCVPADLDPGQTLACSGTIDVMQAEIDAGGDLVNTATVTGDDPDGSEHSDSATWDIPISTNADIGLTKVARAPYDVDADGNGVADTPITAPTTVEYDLVATNSGNVTLSGVTIADPLLTGLVCGPIDLDPGDSLTCGPGEGASLVVDQPKIDAGGDIYNSATATGTDPDAQTVSDVADWDIPIKTAALLTLAKTSITHPDSDGDGVADTPITAPTTIEYELVATNTGNVTVSDVRITDALLGGPVCGPVTLAPGASLTCDAPDGASYDVTQADIDAGTDIVNVATATGTDPGTRDVVDTARYSVPVAVGPAIDLEKRPRAPYFDDADGDRVSDNPITAPTTVEYDLVATNTGNVTLTQVVVEDPLLGATISCDQTIPASLAPGVTLACTGTYQVTQQDIDTKADIVNVGVARSEPQQVSAYSSWDIPIGADPVITLTKSSTNLTDADGNGVADTAIDAPTTVDYQLVVTNSGNQSLTEVTVVDPQLGTLTCDIVAPVTLDPGESLTCDGDAEITQSDIDLGVPFLNRAVASGAIPAGDRIDDTDTFVVPIDQAPSIEIAKTGKAPYTDSDGDGVSNAPLTSPVSVGYDLVVTNTGNVTLTDVVVSDPLLDTAGLVCTPTLPTTLGVGESVSCEGSFDVTQTVIDTGGDLVNNAEVNANFGGRALIHRDTYDIPIEQNPDIEITKNARTPYDDADGDGIADNPVTGLDTITYDLVATNTGNITLRDVVIDDAKLVGTLQCTTPTPAQLAPGDVLSCAGTYDVTQADLDAGADLVNLALVIALGQNVFDSDGYDIPVDRRPALDVTKTSTSHPDSDGDGIADTPIDAVGPVDYEITVTNTGNVSLTGVVIDDPMLSGCTAFAVGTLAPGASSTCSDSFDVSQLVIDNGGDLVNTAGAAGNAGGRLVIDRDTYDIPIERRPSLVATKSAQAPFDDADGDGTADASAVAFDVVDYVVSVTNTGNVTLSSLTPTDSLTTLTCADSELVPGASTTCSGPYTVRQEDVDGLTPIQNVATVTGTSPSGQDVTSGGGYLVPVLALPDLVVRKSIPTNPDTDGDFVADTPLTGPATIDYEIVVANAGTVSLTNVGVTDTLLSSITCPSGLTFDLLVGAVETCTGSFVVTQAIFDSGLIPPGGTDPVPVALNIAAATGTAPGGASVAGAWIAGIAFDQQPQLVLEKTSTSHPDAGGDGLADAPITGPTTVSYELTATNTGNVTLTNVTISDPMLPSMSCGPAVLAPGDTLTCSDDRDITQVDIDSGSDILNIATATGTFGSATLTDRSVYDIPIESNAVLELVKTSTSHPDADGDSTADLAADTPGNVSYRLTATNTGNTTLFDVAIDDPDLGVLTCTPAAPATLSPGASIVCEGTNSLTQADIDAGVDVVNRAAAAGRSSSEGPVIDEAAFAIPIERIPGLEVTKTPPEQSFTIGSQADLEWTITVSNTGNVTLTDLELTDVLVVDDSGDSSPLPACSTSIGTLAPGASTSITCEVSRTITNLEFANVASVQGQSPVGSITDGAVAVVRSLAPPTTVPPTTVPPPSVPGGGGLPPTGSSSSHGVTIAVLLLLGGVGAFASTRVRRPETPGC